MNPKYVMLAFCIIDINSHFVCRKPNTLENKGYTDIS